MIEISYIRARAGLKALLSEVTDRGEPVIIRRSEGDVAMIAADDLRGLIETVHLLRSPANAHRLLRALDRAQEGESDPELLARLRADLGLAGE